ncbi:MAG TPA: PepSY domain-containing protein [Taishania sp.]|nr:PepSY domain-containing protein [Taishania sp.]
MTIRSIWRLSHLSLALVASLFLILASISGIFLSFEPIQEKAKSHYNSSWNTTSLATTIDSLKQHHYEVISIEQTKFGVYIATTFNEEGEQEIFEFNPTTGKKVGNISEQNELFNWMTTFHRSLFLDELGRFFVGITAVILCFIAITGIILVIQRTNSFKALVDKVEKSWKIQFYHIVFGRLAFIPIIILSVTGGYLFLVRFNIIEAKEIPALEIDFSQDHDKLNAIDFKSIQLREIQKVEFPLFPDEEEVYIIHTDERVLAVDQFEFKILQEETIPTTNQFAKLSLNLHTGRTSWLWAIVLGLAAISIIYFIYSGFGMTLKKMKGKLKNKYAINDAEIYILFGSESNNTRQLAIQTFDALIRDHHKAYISSLNDYKPGQQIKHILVFTSTYGSGEAPANATKFLKLWKQNPIEHNFTYSVVGFGSLAYPDFCQYAIEIDQLLAKHSTAKQLLPLVKIHNQSYNSYKIWATNFQLATGLHFEIPQAINYTKLPTEKLIVIDKQVEEGNHSFTLTLQTRTAIKFQSGDLLAIYPEQDGIERLYSIGKTGDNTLIISVTKHEFGICSKQLFNLEIGNELVAGFKQNKDFHFNKNRDAIFIGNGTGIGPFIGMIAENHSHRATQLYWGGRTNQAFALYKQVLESSVQEQKLGQLHIALSRESEKKYVYNLIQENPSEIVKAIQKGAIIYICGSLAMQQDVLNSLDKITTKELKKSLSYYQKKGQIKMDCY